MTSDPVIFALEAQAAQYERLAKLAEIQHEHVQHNQTEALLDVLTRRAAVLDEIKRLEAVIEPAKGRWPDYLAGLGVNERSRGEAALATARRLLEEITAADKNDALILQQRKLNLGRQIHQAAAARNVNRNYAAAAYGARPARMDVSR